MSKSLKEELSELIARGEALVIVGAGVSLGATDGISEAGWKGLLLSGVGACGGGGAGLGRLG